MGKNFKLLMTFLLCLLGMAGGRAQSNVAQWNGNNYETLQAAFDAAEEAVPATIEVTLLADAELDVNARSNILSIGTSNTQSIVINGGNHTLTFNQKNSDWNDVSTANDAVTKLVLNNMDITNSGHNDGPWNRHDINFSCAVELNNVTSDKALAFKNDATLNNVTITDTGNIYGIWIQPNGQNVSIDGLTLTVGRGIKIDDQYVENNSQKVTLDIANATFNTTEKSAIAVKNHTGAVITASNYNIENVAADKTNLVWIDKNRPNEVGLVSVTGATAILEGSIAKIEETGNFYSTIADAVAAATAGQTIEIFKAGDYTLPNLPNNITIKGTVDGVVFNGNVAENHSIASIPNGATFKNVTFEMGQNNYHGFQHAGTINMEGCTFNGKFFSYGDMNFTNCKFNQTASDYHMWAYSGNLTYTGCTFTNTATGKFLHAYNESGATKYTVTVNNCKFVNNASAANKAALNVKATCTKNGNTFLLAYDVIINNCTTEGAFPTAVGEQANADKTWILNPLAQVDDRKISPDNITVTQDGVLIYPEYTVKVVDNEGNESKYGDMKDAFDAINANPKVSYTITLLKDANYSDTEQYRHAALTEENTVTKNVVIDGANHTLTFVGGGVRGFYTQSTVAEKVTFQNMTIADNTRYDAQNGNNAWEFAYLEMGEKESCALEFTNVKFADGISVDGTKTTFTDCEFIADGNDKRDPDKQTNENCMWISNGEVAINNCTFTGYRAIKLHEDYGSEISSVVIDGCTIKDLVKKPAVAIGTLNAATSVTITNCTIEGVQKGDQSMYLYESDTDLANFTNNFSGNTFNVKDVAELTAALNTGAFNKAVLLNDIALTADITCGLEEGTFTLVQGNKTLNAGDFSIALNSGVTIVTDKQTDVFTAVESDMYTVEETVLTEGDYRYQYKVTALPAVAAIGENGYPTLQKAIDVAYTMTGDVTITLLDNIEGYSIVHQKAGLNLTIDGAEKTLAGQIIIDGDGRLDGTETLTIQNIKFDGNTSNFYNGTDAFILVPNTKESGKPYYTGGNKYNHAHNITISSCTFNGVYPSVVGFKTNSGTDGTNNVIIENVTATNMHSLAQLTAVNGATFDNCSATQTGNFIGVNGGGGTYTVSNCTFESHPDKADGYAYREKSSSTAVATLTNNNFKAHDAIILGSAGTINVKSGTYEGEISKTAGTISISGGRFSAELGNSAYAQFIAEGLYGVNGIYPDTPDTPNGIGDAVATVTVGETVTNYASLEAAVAAVTNSEPATITMLADVTISENVVIGGTYGSTASQTTAINAQNITLDLNGHKISGDKTIYLAGGSLNITGEGTIENTGTGASPVGVRYVDSTSGLDYTSERTLTIDENVKLKGKVYGLNIFGTNSDRVANNITVNVNGKVEGILFVLGNLTNDNNNIVINVNGSVDASGIELGDEKCKTGIALNGNAKLIVNAGASVKGETGIEVRAGELTVNGGTITATAEDYSYTANNSGTTIKGAAIAVASYNAEKELTVTVSDGALDGTKLIAVVDVQNNMENVTVTAKDEFVDGADETVIPQDYKWASNNGTSTLVPCVYVAQIGETKYESLTAAVNAAQTGETIELLADITTETGNKSLKEGVTLDGKGKTISGDIAIYISKNGGTIQNVNFKNIHNAAKKKSAVYSEYLEGTATITGCTFDNCDWDAIQIIPVAGGNVVITNNTFSDDNEDGITQKRYIHIQSAENVDFSATITENVMTGNNGGPMDVYYPTDKSKLNLTNNYIEVVDDVLCILVADDNGFAGELAFPAYTTADKEETYSPEAYIQNDLYSAKFYMTFAEAVPNDGNGEKVISLVTNVAEAYTMSEGQTLKVKKNGKTFKTPIAPDGFVVSSSTADGVTTYTVVEADIEYTAANGTVSYKTWSNSLSATGTYKLLKDVTATARITPGILASDITLDLNGHTLTSTATDCAILLSRAGSATSPKSFSLVDTSEDGRGTLAVNPDVNIGIQVSGKYNNVTIGEGVTIDGDCVALLSENQTLTVNGTINGGNDFAVATNGSTTKNATININEGAVLTSEITAVYLPGTGTTTISGGTITGSNGIYVKSGELNITGGEITGNGEATEFVHNPNGTSSVGAALVVENCGYPGGDPVVNVTGGTFTSTNADAIASYSYGDGNEPIAHFVHGGYFSSELDREICEVDKKCVPSTVKEGYYELDDIIYVAKIGEVKYESFEDAWNAVQDGETITLLANCAGNGIIAPQGKFTTGVTVDFAGFTYTVDGELVGSTGTESQAFQLLKDNKITFKNGTIYSEKARMLVQNYSDLTLEGMTLTLNNANYSSAYTLSNNNGTVVIDGTTINANPAGGFAFDVCRYSSYPSVNVTVQGNSEINGDIEVYAGGGDPKDGMYLTVEGGTINGNLNLTTGGAAAITDSPEKAIVKKNNDVDLDAPADFKWRDNGDGTSTLVPCEYICAIGTTKYETLAEAVAAAGTSAATITLLTEAATAGVISGDGVVVPSGSNITFNLNGLTYNVSGETVGSSGTETQGFQLLKDSDVKFQNGTLKATAATAQMIIQNYSNLTLENVILDGTELSGWAYALSNNTGTINLTGSTSIIAKEGGVAFDTYKSASYPNPPTVIINTTGEISGPIEVTGGKLNIENGKFDVTWVTDSHYAAGDIQITGGIYTAEVIDEYCAEGYVCTDNEDEETKAQYPYTVKSREETGIYDLVDWEPYPYQGETKMTPRISYTRDTNLVDDRIGAYRCWYVPFDYIIKESDTEKADFFKVHMIASSNQQGGVVDDNTQIYIHIESLKAGDKLTGNRPYVIRYKELGVFKYEQENTKIYKADNQSSRLHVSTSEWEYDFYGTYDEFKATTGYEWISLYKTGKIAFNASAAGRLQQYRWYIKLTPNQDGADYSNLRIGFVVDGEEDPTSIFAIEDAEGSDEISGIYSVNGTKYGTTMDDLQKGVNIIRYKNGTSKKVLVK